MITMEREKIVPECVGCRRLIEHAFCAAYLVPHAKWRIGKCPLATHLKKEEMTDLGRKQFAGKRTSLAAMYGAVGYKFGADTTNPSRTPGSSKGENCKASQLFKWMAKTSRAYKHKYYWNWCKWSNRMCRVEKVWGGQY